MKKRSMLLALLLALAVSACAGDGVPDAGGTPLAESPDYADTAVPDAPAPLAGEPEIPEHIHTPSEGNNIVDHDPAYYCGNTMTAVSRVAGPEEEFWEASFDGIDSVDLTDLLLHLDYSGPVCKCLPEYNVDTEFGTGYGINLTEGHVRYDSGQVSLTAEQVEEIQAILDRQGAN